MQNESNFWQDMPEIYQELNKLNPIIKKAFLPLKES